MADDASPFTGAEVAVVGMAGRFPGARTLDEYWRNLRDGVESVRVFTDDELRAAGERPELLAGDGYVRAQPSLDDVDRFDAGFFGMSARDAALTDPQHRLFLELAWEAMEHAGYAPDAAPGAVGVFAACGQNTYMMRHLVPNAEVMETVGEWLVRHTGNDMNFLATRVSYQMNLRGPSMNVQTACSSALVAVHLACQHLLSGECDMALAGAATVLLPQGRGYVFQPGEILAVDGHCRPFDARATGTVFGSGGGCVVLKRLADALADGDQILAVVRGSAVNNDGADKVSFLAPGVEGQARAVTEALAVAGVDARSISYVEAHGTGTPVGDPIEVTALTRAFRAGTDDVGFCGLGSAKANHGHLGEAAGAAGLIKTVLALGHRELPPSINYASPNPELGLAGSPFYVNDRLRPWAPGGPRRAGVTALGAGGTNVHVVLEEAPAPPPPAPADARPQLLVVSARSAAAAERAAERLADHLDRHPDARLADAAFTLQRGRKHFAYRRAVVARDAAAAARALREPSAAPRAAGRTAPTVVFAFPGGGAQYPGMGRLLYAGEPAYRDAFDECLRALDPALAARVGDLVLADHQHADAAAATARAAELEAPSLALPALFATEYAGARLLTALGVRPAAYIGHSMGEYVAACLAGVFTVADAMALVATRGRLFETLPAGGMLSVNLPEAELRPLLGHELSVAAANAPALCVASGPAGALDRLQRELEGRGVDVKRIPITVAAHSRMLEPILDEFRRACRGLRLAPPTAPWASNVTGALVTAEEATDPEYWVRHLRGTVRFADGVDALVAGGPRVFVEVGPGRTLSSLARQHPSSPAAIPSMRQAGDHTPDLDFLLGAAGRAWQAGAPVDFAALHEGAARRRVALPTYPFERERHWYEAPAPDAEPRAAAGPMRKQPDVADWFRVPAWRRSVSAAAAADADGAWLVFADDVGLAERVAEHRGERPTVLVRPGDRFARHGDALYTVRAGSRADYDALFEDLALAGRDPAHVVYLWTVTAPARAGLAGRLRRPDALAEFDRAQGFYFYGLLHLAQALGQSETPRTLTVVSTGMHDVGGDAEVDPAKSLAVGPLRVIPREMPHVRTRGVDVALGEPGTAARRQAVERLLRELDAPAGETLVALRGGARWVQQVEPLRLEPPAPNEAPAYRPGAVVLVTGGLGGIGLELALHLARTRRAKLVLVGRSAVPPRPEWEAFRAAQAVDDPMAARIGRLLEIEAAGGECLAVAGDVTDVDAMRAVVAAARRRFGRVDHVVHAAGALDDGLIGLKTTDQAARVILPKARGALVLEHVLRDDPPDTFTVFSSVSAQLGLEGQIDYTAANAFLDAFARRVHARGRSRAVSIGWNAWQQVGMAAALADRGDEGAVLGRRPTGEHAAPGGAYRASVTTPMRPEEQWLLGEHVVRGAEPVLPGTAYLAMANAAADPVLRERAAGAHAATGVVELRDVTFVWPFAVPAGARRELHLRLTDDAAGGVRFAFESETPDAPHVVGRAALVAAGPAPDVALGDLTPRLPRRGSVVDGWLDQPFVRFGGRWANVEEILLGDGEAVVRLALPAAYAADLDELQPHPAMMDMATGAAQALIPGFDQASHFFVPLSYGRVTVRRPLPRRLWSHVRYRAGDNPEVARFDVTLRDEAWRVLVEVADFRMKRIADARVMAGASAAAPPVPNTPAQAARGGRRAAGGGALGEVVRNGIAPAEGMDAFDRVLARVAAGEIGGPVVASSVDVGRWAMQLEARARGRGGAGAGGGPEAAGVSRPDLSTSYVAPRNAVETALAEVWADLLGVAQVGVHDDFFDLGGQSLVAVRMLTRVCGRYGVDLPLSVLFDAPTIAKIAVLVAEEAGIPLDAPGPAAPAAEPAATTTPAATTPAATTPAATTPAAPAARRGHWRSLVAMQRGGNEPAFYCVAGMGGTLNNLRHLAVLLGGARPVYGLQPPGADNRHEIRYSVEELAEHYVREVREVQPRGPYYLGGYSGGGVAAYEMARQLTAAGEPVAFLGLIDSFSPALPQRSAAQRLLIHLARVREQGPGHVLDTLRRRYAWQRGDLVLRLQHALGAVAPRRYRYESIQQSWNVAAARYRPGPWDGCATLFRAREESATSLWTAYEVDDAYGWRRYLTRGVDVEPCPGNHSTMCEEPNARVLAAKLRHAMASRGPESATPSGASAHDGAVDAGAPDEEAREVATVE